MAKLVWDQTGQKRYETGTDRGVVYPFASGKYQNGAAWTGLRSVSESPDGAEETALYADNIKYVSLTSAENFKGSIGAYTYPDEVAVLDGTAQISKGISVGQQNRPPFGFSYRTFVGNDTEGNDHAYKIHLVYGAKISPSSRENNTVNDSPSAVELSWNFTTTPEDVPGFKRSAHIIIESEKVDAATLKKIEDTIYGTDSKPATLPTPSELVTLIGTK